MNKFKVGDIIKGIDERACGSTSTKMTRGKVTWLWADGDITVKILEHTESGRIGREVLADPKYFALIEPAQKIVITADGSKTVARLYEKQRDGFEKLINTKEAKCAPGDTYDFATGAELAFDRLIGRIKPAEKTDKPEYKPGDKVKVIGNSCCHPWKKGDILTLVKIYVPFAGGAQAWRIDEAGRENNYIREPDFEPYAEPAKAEPAKEPIKLYCTADADGMQTIRKGDICELDSAAKTFKFPNGYVSPYEYSSVEDFCERNPRYAKAKFVPLVSRPAKVGEWVLITDAHYSFNDYANGEVHKVTSLYQNIGINLESPDAVHADHDEYLVLDGYNPEPEFVPHLECDGIEYGVLGTPTNYKDAVGRPLVIGDVVEKFSNGGESRGNSFMVCPFEGYGKGKAFIIGIEAACDAKSGSISDYRILLKIGYADVGHGTSLGGVRCIKEQP